MKPIVNGVVFALLATMIIPTTMLANTATIEEVIRGDRIKIKGWEVVRLTGIITPKLDEPFGQKAYQFAKKELEGKLVVIATYTIDNTAEGIVRDAEGLCMVHIEYDGDTRSKGKKSESDSLSVDFNALMLEKGLARVDETYLPESLQHYREIEREAKSKKLGIWSVEGGIILPK